MDYKLDPFFIRMKERLTTDPLPSGSLAQRDLGDREILFEFLVWVTHPDNSDMILALVTKEAQQLSRSALDHLWMTRAFTHVAKAKVEGVPVTLLANTLNDEEAARISMNSILMLSMYAKAADPGRFDEIIENLRRMILDFAPSLPPLTTDTSKFVPRDMSDPHGRAIAYRILNVCTKVQKVLDEYY